MPMSRRTLVGLLAAAPCAHAGDGRAEEPVAASTAPPRYWPVATDHPRVFDIAAEREDGGFIGSAPLRRFNAPRPSSRADNPTRRHVGVDLFAHAGDAVVAVEDGRIVAFYPFLRAATGEMSYALMVAHDGYVANYGEVRGDSLSARGLALGAAVSGGQEIATVSDTRQLHFETYEPGVTRNRSWRHGAARPAGALDPTALLFDLAAKGRRLRPGEAALAAHRQGAAAGE
jgi:murein DD-endopeptidase MepM/ murein hydrolase activator NlpD